MGTDYLGTRLSYSQGALSDAACAEDPIALFSQWLKDAHAAGTIEPSAMTLSTVDSSGQPRGRIVLLREFTAEGAVFYTNYASAKGCELLANPRAAATFWWPELERQVRIEGRVTKTTEVESDRYFNGRPADSRIASATSPQSKVIPSREYLEERIAAHHGQPPPRPEHWGGYRLSIEQIEFWQGRPARIHDRLRFRRSGDGWLCERLAP